MESLGCTVKRRCSQYRSITGQASFAALQNNNAQKTKTGAGTGAWAILCMRNWSNAVVCFSGSTICLARSGTRKGYELYDVAMAKIQFYYLTIGSFVRRDLVAGVRSSEWTNINLEYDIIVNS